MTVGQEDSEIVREVLTPSGRGVTAWIPVLGAFAVVAVGTLILRHQIKTELSSVTKLKRALLKKLRYNLDHKIPCQSDLKAWDISRDMNHTSPAEAETNRHHDSPEFVQIPLQSDVDPTAGSSRSTSSIVGYLETPIDVEVTKSAAEPVRLETEEDFVRRAHKEVFRAEGVMLGRPLLYRLAYIVETCTDAQIILTALDVLFRMTATNSSRLDRFAYPVVQCLMHSHYSDINVWERALPFLVNLARTSNGRGELVAAGALKAVTTIMTLQTKVRMLAQACHFFSMFCDSSEMRKKLRLMQIQDYAKALSTHSNKRLAKEASQLIDCISMA